MFLASSAMMNCPFYRLFSLSFFHFVFLSYTLFFFLSLLLYTSFSLFFSLFILFSLFYSLFFLPLFFPPYFPISLCEDNIFRTGREFRPEMAADLCLNKIRRDALMFCSMLPDASMLHSLISKYIFFKHPV